MTPEQRQRVEEEFQRLSGLAAADVAAELQRLRERDPTVAAEVERLLASEGGRSRATESPAVSEQLREALGSALAGSGPTLRDERGSPRIVDTQRVGPYRVIRELGHGGLGYVLLCVREDDRFHKRVAVKLVKKGMDTEEILRRFEQERQVLSALNHPNIARVFDAGTTADGRPYFVMEYVDGVPIDTYCDSQGLSTEERLKLFRKVCVAVHYAHQNLIVHRDIKPTNIMVTPDGEPKLLDFGIAKLLNPDLLFSPVTTGPELRLMTPEYASPEQVEGMPITTSSDVYSLGVLLYTLLTGHAPYKLRSRVREEIVRVVCNIDPERPSTSITKAVEVESADGTTRTVTPEEVAKNRDVQVSRLRRRLAGDIDNIVLMAMRKKPPRRYKSAEQFAEDIDRHLSGKPVIASPETWVYVAGKFISRNRVGLAAVVLIFASLVGGLGIAAWQWRAAQTRYEQVLGLARSNIDLQKKIGDQVGSSAAQRVLVEASLPALDNLARVSRPDAALNELLASGYAALGGIERDARNSGSIDRSIRAYTSALEGRRKLAAQRPRDPERRAAVGLALVDLARAQAVRGPAEAEAALREALDMSTELQATHPAALSTRRLHAAARAQEGRQLARTSDPTLQRTAAQALDESAGVLRAMRGERDVDAQWLGVALATVLADRGDLNQRTDNAAEAEVNYRDAAAALTACGGDGVDVQRGLAAVSEKLGHLLINQAFEAKDRLDEAIAELNKAGRIAIRLATDDPMSENNAVLLRRLYEHQGDAILLRGVSMSERGRADDAKVLYRKSLEFLRPFFEQSEQAWRNDPVIPLRRRALATACEKIADAHRCLDEFKEAESFYRRAAELYQSSAGADSPERLKKRSGICLASLGIIHQTLQQPNEAIDAYTRAISDLEVGLADPEAADYTAQLLSITAQNLGPLLLERHEPTAAIPVLIKARDSMPPKATGRINVLMRLGSAYAVLSPPDLVRARATLEDARSTYKSLTAAGDQDHHIHMEACSVLGTVLSAQGESAAARSVLREGLDTYARVAKPDAEIEQLRSKLASALEAQPAR